MSEQIKQVTFADLGLRPGLLQLVQSAGFTTPTPIQAQAIPVGLSGKDVLGIAQTGTGKTLAFALPILNAVAGTDKVGLVLLPTRELALQVEETFRKVAGKAGLRSAVLIGGQSMIPQLKSLRNRPNVIIATPGRLIDHLGQKTVKLSGVSVLVLDEADRMLDMGFMPQIEKILAAVPKERQTMLFSATMADEVVRIAKRATENPVRIDIAPAGTAAERVDQEIVYARKDEKIGTLAKILSETEGSTLVFTRTKHGARKVCRDVQKLGHTATEIHGDRSLGQRRAALDAFKRGTARVLVATDIAARGIDVTGIALVVNFDLPTVPDDYVHRIGRTGRNGLSGRAISMAQPNERDDVRRIERVMRRTIPVSTQFKSAPAPESVRDHEKHVRTGGYTGGFGTPRPAYGGSRAPRSQGSRGGFAKRSAPRATESRPAPTVDAPGKYTMKLFTRARPKKG